MSQQLYQNNKKLIVKVALPATIGNCFDYLPPVSMLTQDFGSILSGCRVKVPFGKRTLIGFIISTTNNTNIAIDKLKAIEEIVDLAPIIPNNLLQLLLWCSSYYHCPLGQILKAALPKAIRENKLPLIIPKTDDHNNEATHKASQVTGHNLNVSQQHAVACILKSMQQFSTFLLHGITGSGKTEVYLQLIQQVIAADKQVLVLIPEIGLTPQTLKRFQQRFQLPIAVLHSQLTTKERASTWMRAKHGEVKIILGTRSAAFVPLQNPGLYIVDEEHDPSFKQQVTPRYSARDLLIRRAQMDNCPIVLGSATPALESLHNVNQSKYKYLPLPIRAGAALQPSMQILDIRHKRLEQGLSAQLLDAIAKNLAANDQTLIFLNRRGYAPVLICHACGWTKNCTHCDAKMIVHHYPKPQIICHHCQTKHSVPDTCHACNNHEVKPLGLGTERLEQVLQSHFPTANIARLDKDTTQKKQSLLQIIDKIQNGEVNIVLGTQMLAKGHHFPNITLVAILDIDSALFSADFRATERMGQLITQVAGRAGREHKPGHVIIQTHHPEHPLLQLLLHSGYPNFCDALFTERKLAKLPPFSHQILFRSQAKTIGKALALLTAIKTIAQKNTEFLATNFLGPVPAPMEKRVGVYRAQLLLQAPTRKLLQSLCLQLIPAINQLPQIKGVRWSIDVDPVELY